jgi:hypothetical protein
VDVANYEGGPPEDVDLVLACPGPMPTSANAPPMSNAPQGPTHMLGDTTNILRIKILLPSQVIPAQSEVQESQRRDGVDAVKKPSRATCIIQGNGFTLCVLKSIAPADFEDTAENDSENDSENEAGKKKAQHTFSPTDDHEPIINIIEWHYCAHPVIPGYTAPDPVSIK